MRSGLSRETSVIGYQGEQHSVAIALISTSNSERCKQKWMPDYQSSRAMKRQSERDFRGRVCRLSPVAIESRFGKWVGLK